jgi:hypothetical protein
MIDDNRVRPVHLLLALLEIDGATRLGDDARDRIRKRVLTALHEARTTAA